MRTTTSALAFVALAANLAAAAPVKKPRWQHPAQDDYLVSLGVRPYYLIQNVSSPSEATCWPPSNSSD